MRFRLLAFVAALGLLASACDGDGPARDGSGNITETGSASVFELRVGDCFDDDTDPEDVVSEVPVRPCAEPHDNEIYFEYRMTESVFPGRDRILELTSERCLQEFEAFVGVPYPQSDLDLFPITPTSQSWDEGDRTVYCALYALDLSKLEGSMRDSRR